MNKIVIGCLLVGTLLGCGKHEAEATKTSQLWTQYVEARGSGMEPVLADFSFAGYHAGEVAIPNVDWQVFDVTDFGAVADDGKSDKRAVMRAIAAAEANGSGIVFFPKGRFRLNETTDDSNQAIVIGGSNIVLRGSGAGEDGTDLYMDQYMDPVDPKKMWTCPYLIQFKGRGEEKQGAKLVKSARRETHIVEVDDASSFQAGDWVVLSMSDNSPETIAAVMAPYKADPTWKKLINEGYGVEEFHLIERIDGNAIRFKEPIHENVVVSQDWALSKIDPLQEVGVEHMTLSGNWQDAFVHHESAIHDGGWSMLSLSRCVNSWIRDCRFVDLNRPVVIKACSATTAQDILLQGNKGHNAISVINTSHSMVRRVNDTAGHHHAVGVAGKSVGNVFHRCAYREDTCYESHASQPRWTLFDNIEGGWMYGRWGGAVQSQPNHLEGLVFWNYKNIGKGEPGAFHFMRPDSEYGRIIMPYVIGFHGNPQEWVEAEIELLESNGSAVYPASIYEAQFEHRTQENAPERSLPKK